LPTENKQTNKLRVCRYAQDRGVTYTELEMLLMLRDVASGMEYIASLRSVSRLVRLLVFCGGKTRGGVGFQQDRKRTATTE
jgi:hypothetical protein